MVKSTFAKLLKKSFNLMPYCRVELYNIPYRH